VVSDQLGTTTPQIIVGPSIAGVSQPPSHSRERAGPVRRPSTLCPSPNYPQQIYSLKRKIRAQQRLAAPEFTVGSFFAGEGAGNHSSVSTGLNLRHEQTLVSGMYPIRDSCDAIPQRKTIETQVLAANDRDFACGIDRLVRFERAYVSGRTRRQAFDRLSTAKMMRRRLGPAQPLC
jgi:hypothetical protein